MDIVKSEHHLRLLAVQTQSQLLPEVGVFKMLLEKLPHLAREQDKAVDVLLFQGVDVYTDPEIGRQVASLFGQIRNVTVHEVKAGKLGQWDTPAFERVMKMRDLVNMRRARKQLLARAHTFAPDLVYCSAQRWDARVAPLLADSLGCPLVVHVHCAPSHWLGRDILNVLQQADAVIAISEFVREDAIRQGVAADRVHVVYNSVEVARELSHLEHLHLKRSFCSELSIPEDSLLVGMTGRLSHQKGQEELLQAMLPILRHDRHIHLVLAGSEIPAGTGLAERIRESARTHDVLAQVHLLGHRSDVPRILDALDVFAHPSRDEGLGLAVLEAAAHGLPVAAWHEGGITEVVVSGETGLLVEPMDIEGLRGALQRLILDQDLRRTMGGKARERVRTTFSPDVVAASFLSVLQTAAGHTSPIARVG